MYFDHCQEPADLKRAISDFMKIQTGRRISVAGVGREGLTIRNVDEHTDQTLRQGYAEAQAVAQRMKRANPRLPDVPSVSVVPLEGLAIIAGWCEQAAAHWVEPKPMLNEQRQPNEVPGRAGGAAQQRQSNRKQRQMRRILRRLAGRIDKWAKSQPPFAPCSHPGVEPAGTAEKVGERIQDQIKNAISYDSKWGFRRVLSLLRLQGHQGIADTAERALDDLLDAVKSKTQEAAETLSPRIYYEALVEQAKLSVAQIQDGAAELEKVLMAENGVHGTPLRPMTAECIREAHDKIDREILNSWRFFRVNHDVEFEGSPHNCFWAGKPCGRAKAIRPALKEAIQGGVESDRRRLSRAWFTARLFHGGSRFHAEGQSY